MYGGSFPEATPRCWTRWRSGTTAGRRPGCSPHAGPPGAARVRQRTERRGRETGFRDPSESAWEATEVTKRATSLTLEPSDGSIKVGQTTTLRATLTGGEPGSDVTFSEVVNGVPTPIGTAPVLTAPGLASLDVNPTVPTTYRATYPGDSIWASASSPDTLVKVAKWATTLKLHPSRRLLPYAPGSHALGDARRRVWIALGRVLFRDLREHGGSSAVTGSTPTGSQRSRSLPSGTRRTWRPSTATTPGLHRAPRKSSWRCTSWPRGG